MITDDDTNDFFIKIHEKHIENRASLKIDVLKSSHLLAFICKRDNVFAYDSLLVWSVTA